jgi:hypothetical protein
MACIVLLHNSEKKKKENPAARRNITAGNEIKPLL